MIASDIIVALKTAPGAAGVAVLRLSGQGCGDLLRNHLSPASPLPERKASLRDFVDAHGDSLDQGLVLYFPAPHSFTGEDVVEFQGHGSPVMMAILLRQLQQSGARLARPGEFSERAFHHGRLDLAQAEAIADLIAAGSEQAARSAMRSLQGEFSRRVESVEEVLTALRVYVEAAIDFSDQDIDFLHSDQLLSDLRKLRRLLSETLQEARQGQLLQKGISVVIAGHPNVGKSSLLNALAGDDVAIVSEHAGTTRDVLRQNLLLQGMPLQILDTAGWRDSDDPIESEGIKRALQVAEQADALLYLFDTDADLQDIVADLQARSTWQIDTRRLLLVRNKIDRCPDWQDSFLEMPDHRCEVIGISAKYGQGIDKLKHRLAHLVGRTPTELPFLARQRHIEALEQAWKYLEAAEEQLQQGMGDLAAEDLRCMQGSLASLCGEMLPDDLLGRIFASFCIGK